MPPRGNRYEYLCELWYGSKIRLKSPPFFMVISYLPTFYHPHF